MSKKWTNGEIGSISDGTLRNQDLLESFIWELRHLGHRSTKLTRIENRYERAINGEFGEDDAYFTDESANFDLEDLTNMLQEHALPYMYFGAHCGDGSDFGFWLDEDLDSVYDGLRIDDLDRVPANYRGEVMYINDHGNMTLYWKNRKGFKEIWSLV